MDYGDPQVRKVILEDLKRANSWLGSFTIKRQDYRYLFRDNKSKHISTSIGINKNSISVRFALFPDAFQYDKKVFVQLHQALPDEPGIATWKDLGQSTHWHTFTFVRRISPGDPWPPLKAWLVDRSDKLRLYASTIQLP